MNEYLLKVKKIIDSLALVGALVTMNEHIEVILDDLFEEYEGIVTSIISRVDPYIVEDIESMLMTQEEIFKKIKKDFEMISTSFAQISTSKKKKTQ